MLKVIESFIKSYLSIHPFPSDEKRLIAFSKSILVLVKEGMLVKRIVGDDVLFDLESALELGFISKRVEGLDRPCRLKFAIYSVGDEGLLSLLNFYEAVVGESIDDLSLVLMRIKKAASVSDDAAWNRITFKDFSLVE